MDLSKAFDRVPRGLLVDKLIKVRVPDRLVRWIPAYLQNLQPVRRL